MATLNKVGLLPAHRTRNITAFAALVIAGALAWIILKGGNQKPLDVYRQIADIEFSDPVLKKCVQTNATANSWQKAGEFLQLHCNNSTGNRIRSIAGIEHLVALNKVNLAFNEIADATPLANLPRLEIVDLSHNNIRQVPVFRSATNLRQLELNHNSLDTIESITAQNFSVLELLSVANNQIADLGTVGKLTELRILIVRNNRITSLGAISGLVKLELVDAGGNEIRDLNALDGLDGLRELFLDDNQISELQGLEHLQQLEELDLSNNPLQSTTQLAYVFRLQRLNLDQTGTTDLSSVLELGDITLLQLAGNPGLGCEIILEAIQEYGEKAIIADQYCEPRRAE